MRKTIFDKLIKNENDFTELFCNMTKFEDFKSLIISFLGIEKNKNPIFDTQYITKNNGRPDLVISFDDGIEFIEVKVDNRKLTKNQPEGYIKELLKRKEANKKLYFVIPKKYNYKEELNYRIKNTKKFKISIEIRYWEEFFEFCKNKNIYSKNNVLGEYYNLLKSWFGYETVIFSKKEKDIMNENGKVMYKAQKWLESISSLLIQNGYDPEWSKESNEIGLYINKKNNYYGWIGIWFPLWKDSGDCFVYTISDKDKPKFYNNFVNIYKKCKTYEDRENDKPDGVIIFKYISFDNYIFDNKNDESVVFKKLLEILKNLNIKQEKS